MILDGKATAKKIKERLKEKILDYKPIIGRAPKLVVILVGNDPASETYVRNKEKACKLVGIETETIRINADPEPTAGVWNYGVGYELKGVIEKANRDKDVDGILLQLPLPKELDPIEYINLIDPRKDVDGFTALNKGKLYTKQATSIPCTPFGIIKLLDEYGIDVSGKHAVVIGRSDIVGQPVAKLLLDLNATVTICHSKTTNLADIARTADIIVAAVGKPNFVTADMVKDGVVVIDVGINRTDDGLCGDVKYDEVEPKASYITPVPGGVGPMTIAMLLENTFRRYVINNLR